MSYDDNPYPRPEPRPEVYIPAHLPGQLLPDRRQPIEFQEGAQLDYGSDFIVDNPEANEIVANLGFFDKIQDNHFYTKSEDKNGHTETVRARIPKNWRGAISYIIEKVPAYKCDSDFFRDALMHRLKWLGKHFHEIDPSEFARMEVEVIGDRYEVVVKSYEAAKKSMEKSVTLALKQRDWTSAERMLIQYRSMGDGFDEPYRSRFLKSVYNLERATRIDMKNGRYDVVDLDEED